MNSSLDLKSEVESLKNKTIDLESSLTKERSEFNASFDKLKIEYEDRRGKELAEIRIEVG